MTANEPAGVASPLASRWSVWTSLAIVSIALGSLLAGCSTETELPTRDEYAREVNALCRDAINRSTALIQDAITALYGDNPPPTPTPGELQAFYAGLLPAATESARVIKRMLRDVRALPAPDGIGRDADDLWEAVELRLDKSLSRIEEAVSDPARATELDADDTFPFGPENERAAGLGFTACRLT